MKVKHEEFTRAFGTDRYWLVEAEGSRAGYMSWTQRPAAERNARSLGLGLYDRRAKTVIVLPDREKRLERLRQAIEKAEREAGIARMTIEAIEADDG